MRRRTSMEKMGRRGLKRSKHLGSILYDVDAEHSDRHRHIPH